MSAVSSMSTMAAGKLADYHAAVAQFQAASSGTYAGPSTPFDFLQQKIGAIDGLNPQELVTGTAAAVGPTAVESRGRKSNSMDRGIGGFFRGIAIDALGSFGGGALLDFFDKLATDDADDDLQCRGLMKDSQQCAETIEDICTTSDTAMSEMLEPATHVISILTQFIRRTPLGALASSAVSVASDLIENTNEQIIGACQDRDESVEKCFEEFLRRCGDISVRPLPCEPPDTADCPLPTHPAGEHTCEPPPQDIQPCPEEKKPVDTTPVDTKPVETPTPQPETPPAKSPDPQADDDCEKPTLPPEPDCEKEPTKPAQPQVPQPPSPPEPSKPCEPSASCRGVLGLVGVGVALVGLGALICSISECLEQTCELPEPEPEPTPEPQPEPAPQPEPEPEPVPEPVPEDLSKVPEPTPPPKKLSMLSTAAEVAPLDAVVDSPPSTESNMEASMQASVEPETHISPVDSSAAESTPNSPARKAGAW